jgi:rubrerythrin
MEAKNLLESIQVVKENEWLAAEFYGNAAKTTGSQAGKHLFEQLKEFEEYHFARLSALEQTLQTGGNFIDYEGRDFPLPPTIVPKAVAEPGHEPVMKIISEALKIEKEAETAYADIADKISDPQGHAMFRRLSEEEHRHYQILIEAYWNLNNFQTWNWPKVSKV